MTRKPLRICIAAALYAPLGVMALGLGPIQVRSALNEPLSAEIPVFSAQEGELEELTVGLASRDTFQKAGIDRPSVLTNLQFELIERQNGSALIRVSSQQPIREPILNFLVALDGNRSRLVREFAVFLDPPGFRKPGISLPVTQAATPAAPTRPPVQPPPPTRREPRPDVNLGPGPSYGPVASGETLWRIAERLRPPGVGLQRMINALFRANPQAFARSNPDNLMAGVTLRVPNPQEIAALDGGAAPVAANAPQVAATQPPRLDSDEATSAPVDTGLAGQVRLLSPEGGDSALEGGTGDAAGVDPDPATGSEQEQEPAATIGQAQVAGAVVSAINSAYLIAVRDQGLVGLKLTGMEDLRRRIAELEGSNSESLSPEAPTSTPTPASAPSQPQAPAPAAGPPEAASTTPVAPPVRTVSVPPPPQTGFVDELFEMLGKPLTLAMAGLALLLLLLLLILSRRRRRRRKATEPVQFTPVTVDAEPTPVAAPAMAESPAVRPPPPAMDSPLERADLLIAVGNTAEAEHILRVALTENPGDTALAAKLLDVHFAAGESQAFIEVAEDLRRRVDDDDPLWSHAQELGVELVPEHPLFGGRREAPPDAAPPKPTADAAPPKPAADAPMESMDDLGLDLDWTDLEPTESKTDAPTPSAAERKAADATLPWDVADFQEFRRSRESQQPESAAEGPPKAAEEEDFFSDALAELDWNSTPQQETAPLSDAQPDSPQKDEIETFALDFELADPNEPDASSNTAAPADGMTPETPETSEVSETPPVAEDYVETKLDLAQAYLDMEDPVGARSLLEEVAQEGSRHQKQRADELLRKLG